MCVWLETRARMCVFLWGHGSLPKYTLTVSLQSLRPNKQSLWFISIPTSGVQVTPSLASSVWLSWATGRVTGPVTRSIKTPRESQRFLTFCLHAEWPPESDGPTSRFHDLTKYVYANRLNIWRFSRLQNRFNVIDGRRECATAIKRRIRPHGKQRNVARNSDVHFNLFKSIASWASSNILVPVTSASCRPRQCAVVLNWNVG